MIVFPAIADSNTQVVAVVDGQSYLFLFRWNARDESWYVDVADDQQTAIASGLRIVLGTYIGKRVAHPVFTGGVLVALDTSGQGVEAKVDDLGTRVLILYFDVVEAALLQAGQPRIMEPNT